MFLNDEVSLGWCLGATWRCTPAEAIGLGSVVLCYMTFILVTVIHSALQNQTHEEVTTRRPATATSTTVVDDDWRIGCALVVYFFSLGTGSLLWALAGVRWVHPVQMGPLQLLGSILLVACAVLFVVVHIQLGEHWSPLPEPPTASRQRPQHLVTQGVYGWARHPLYAVFLWAAIGTGLATLNWLIAECVFGLVVFTLCRIETEERLLVERLGGRYLEYRQQVSALGPPWHCLGFDHNGMVAMPSKSNNHNSQHPEHYRYGAQW